MNPSIAPVTLDILTKGDRGHRKTVLTIDWEGITQDQLILLARARIVSRCQHAWQSSETGIPDVDLAKAVDFVQEDVPVRDFTSVLNEIHDIQVDKKIRGVLKGLKKEDKEALLLSLQALADSEPDVYYNDHERD